VTTVTVDVRGYGLESAAHRAQVVFTESTLSA